MVRHARKSALFLYIFLFIGALVSVNSLIGTLPPANVPHATTPDSLLKRNNTKKIETKPVWITVHVHGIISIKPHLTFENFIRFLYDDIQDTHYEQTVLFMRENPFFYQNQSMQNLGLHPVSLKPLKRGAGASLLAYATDKIEQISQPDFPTINHYYTFGWSGLMSHKIRALEAKKMYSDLIALRNDFRKKGIEPHFRLIGYSHGGQLLLSLANARQEHPQDKTLLNDQTLLYGTPVHSFTADNIADPIFGKVYNMYSPGDRIQKLDIFTIGEFSSGRIFKPQHVNRHKNKLVQVEIRVVRKAGEKSLYGQRPKRDFNYFGPRKSYQLRDVSPGHTELWFFGWTPLHYRSSFPLYPLPTVALTPYFLNTIKAYEDDLDSTVPIVMMIDPGNSTTLLKNKHEDCWQAVPFISAKKMHRIRKELEQYAPENFTTQRYNYHIGIAYDEAHLYHTQRQKDRRCKPVSIPQETCLEESIIEGQ